MAKRLNIEVLQGRLGAALVRRNNAQIDYEELQWRIACLTDGALPERFLPSKKATVADLRALGWPLLRLISEGWVVYKSDTRRSND